MKPPEVSYIFATITLFTGFDCNVKGNQIINPE